MTAHQDFSSATIAQIILEELPWGDKSWGELFNLTGKRYPVIDQTLQKLKDKKLIEIYFSPIENASVFTYRLYSRD